MSELIKETLSPCVVPIVQQLETQDGIVAETSFLDVVELNPVTPSSMSIENQIKAGVKPQTIPPLISSRLSSYEQAVASVSSIALDVYNTTSTPSSAVNPTSNSTTAVNPTSTIDNINEPSKPINNE